MNSRGINLSPFYERHNAVQPQTSSDHQGRRYTRRSDAMDRLSDAMATSPFCRRSLHSPFLMGSLA
jgi:hypothetical protein